MSIHRLNASTMLAHSQAWIEDESLREQLTAHPLGAAMMEKIAEAHSDLAHKQGERSATAQHLDGLSESVTTLDAEHDSCARALYYHIVALVGMAEVDAARDSAADGSGQRRLAALRTLSARLFPEGLGIVRRSYLEEAGEVIARDERLTQAEHDLMAATPIGEHTLAELYQRWHRAGSELGRKSRERAMLRASLRNQGSATSPAVVLEAKRRWARTVAALVQIVELLPLEREVREALLGPVEESLRALARSSVSDTDAPESDPDAVPPDDGSGGDGSNGGDGGIGEDGPGDGSVLVGEADVAIVSASGNKSDAERERADNPAEAIAEATV